jgi:anti-sigma-K factor RskA
MSDEHAIRDLLPGHALGCLDSHDALAVERHLPGCPACQGELEGFARVSDALATAIPVAEPPVALEERIMRSVVRSARRGTAQRGTARRGAARARPPLLFSRVGLARSRGLTQPAILSIAAMIVVALLAGNILQWTGVIQRRGQSGSPKLMTALLAGTGDARDAYGTVVLDPVDREGVVAVTGLPRLPGASQYQLWLIRGAERRSGGVFSVDQGGYGSLLLMVPEDFMDFSGFGVSVEPAGGSPAPTGPKVMTGAL